MSAPLTPAVTVAVMTCNQGPFLAACLESLAAQTLRPLRLQLFDNGSGDETPEVLAAFRAQAPSDLAISVRRFDYRGGPAAFFNAVAPLLEGDLVIFQHGDDLAEPERAERLAALFRARPSALLAHSAATAVDAAGRPLEALDFAEPEPAAQPAHHARVQGYVLGATMAVRPRLFELFPPLDERAPEDTQLPFRAALAGEVACSPERLLRYRRHAASDSAPLHRLDGLAAVRQARRAILERMAAVAEMRLADIAHRLAEHPEEAARLDALPARVEASLAEARDEAALWCGGPGQRLAAALRLARRRRRARALLLYGATALAPALELRRRRRRRRLQEAAP